MHEDLLAHEPNSVKYIKQQIDKKEKELRELNISAFPSSKEMY